MIQQYFLVLGYGIPKNIFVDENYNLYLKFVFNAIFDWCTTHDQWNPNIIFSGGSTDTIKPYKRTEAREMMKLFSTLTKRPFVNKRVSAWSLIPETASYSTLENLVFAKIICNKRKAQNKRLIIFCERTRHKRLLTLGKRMFHDVQVIPIDFDQSSNRFFDPSFLKQKESEALAFDLWALQNPKNLREHRALFKKKFAFLRTSRSTNPTDAVKQWWEQELRSRNLLKRKLR